MRTSAPTWAESSGPAFSGATNHSTPASAWRTAKESTSGEWSMSPPRTFNNQATESGADSTTASSFSLASRPATSRRLSAEGVPAKAAPKGNTGFSGGGGRSCHTASTGLESAATRLAPALVQASR